MSERRINAAALAKALADHLAPAIPPEVEVFAVDSTLHVRQAGEPMSGMYADLRTCVADLCFELQNVLDQLQDVVAETTTEPWPAGSPGPMPETFVEIRGDQLIVGFGDPGDPFLRVEPIQLSSLV